MKLHCSQDTWRELLVLLASAAVSASVMFINDCDETFGYWEALHRMLFYREAYPPGGGLLTWEWDPSYALRSYTWLVVLVAPWAHFLLTISRLSGLSVRSSKLVVFYGVRLLLGFGSALSLWALRWAMAPWLGGTPSSTDRQTAVVYLWALSLGSFEASTALLPNTLSLQLVSLAWAAFAVGETAPTLATAAIGERSERTKVAGFQDSHPHDYYSLFRGGLLSSMLVLLLAGILVLWAWPFALIALVPPVSLSLLRCLRSGQGLSSLFLLGAVLGTMALVTLLIERSWYGGTWQFPLWAILKYNVLGGASALYGTESAGWYLKNLTVLFTFLLPLSLLSGPVILWGSQSRRRDRDKKQNKGDLDCEEARSKDNDRVSWTDKWSRSPERSSLLSPLLMLWLSLMLTLLLFSAQAHKEERFLTCIYPNVVILAAALFPDRHPRSRRAIIWVLASLSVWRLLGRWHYYGGPMRVFQSMPQYIDSERTGEGEGGGRVETNICMGKSWYRFPSHWFMPPKSRIIWLHDGNNTMSDPVHERSREEAPPMLPQYPTPLAAFNDQNRGDVRRQYGNWSQCHYYIDAEPSLSSPVPATVRLAPLLCDVILDQERAPGWLRWFWYPSSMTRSALQPFCLFEVQQGKGERRRKCTEKRDLSWYDFVQKSPASVHSHLLTRLIGRNKQVK